MHLLDTLEWKFFRNKFNIFNFFSSRKRWTQLMVKWTDSFHYAQESTEKSVVWLLNFFRYTFHLPASFYIVFFSPFRAEKSQSAWMKFRQREDKRFNWTDRKTQMEWEFFEFGERRKKTPKALKLRRIWRFLFITIERRREKRHRMCASVREKEIMSGKKH